MTQILSSSRSDIGKKRKQNQDSFFSDDAKNLYIVADGMGGHLGGETASRLAVETVRDHFYSKLSEHKSDALAGHLAESILLASHRIFDIAAKQKELEGMGTTTTATFFYQNRAILGQVGDSRVYLLREQTLWQLTRDHSLISEKIKSGILSREMAAHSKEKNVITRSVGFERDAEVDLFTIDIKKGDHFVLCSDGLSGMVSDKAIQKILLHNIDAKLPFSEYANTLIDEANKNGGEDNVTAIVIKIQ